MIIFLFALSLWKVFLKQMWKVQKTQHQPIFLMAFYAIEFQNNSTINAKQRTPPWPHLPRHWRWPAPSAWPPQPGGCCAKHRATAPRWWRSAWWRLGPSEKKKKKKQMVSMRCCCLILSLSYLLPKINTKNTDVSSDCSCFLMGH